MANPSKLSLYIAAVTAGDGQRTVLKTKLVVSNSQLKALLEEESPSLLQFADAASQPLAKYAGNIKTAASLELATDFLVLFVAPMVSVLAMLDRKVSVEVMFNDPVINQVAKRGHLDEWRKNEFSYKRLHKKKEAIQNAGKWAAFDGILRRLNGKLCYNHDDVLREMVGELTELRRNKKL